MWRIEAEMTTGRRGLGTWLVAVMIGIGLQTAAIASPPDEGSGALQVAVIVPTGEESANGQTVRTYSIVAAMAGLAQGSIACDMVETLDEETLAEDIRGACTLTGQIASSGAGTIGMSVAGLCVDGLTGSCAGRVDSVPRSGTGGLTGVQWFRGTWEIPIHAPHTILYEARTKVG